MKEKDMQRGWGFPNGSRKAHYFMSDGRSLCGKYGFYRGPLEPDSLKSPDDCTECRKMVNKLLGVK